MDRRAKPKKGKADAKRPPAPKPPTHDAARVRDLETRLTQGQQREAEALKREAAALEQQRATSEILRVISSSPTNTQPVFEAIVLNAATLCGARDVFLVLVEDNALRAVAATGQLAGAGMAAYNARQVPVDRDSVAGRTIVDRAIMQVADLAALPEEEFAEGRALQRLWGHRSMLATPLLRKGAAVGAIVAFRFEVREFSEHQVALLQTFADQAVIAIENVRLFNETKEALEQHSATSEILRVIATALTDVTPVFDAICRSAVRLLGAYQGGIFRFDGELVHIAALTSQNPEAEQRLRKRFPQAPNLLVGSGRAIVDKRVFQIPDTEEFPFEGQRATARDFGFRRSVWVPMIREEQVIGVLSVNGREPGLYSERQIELLKTFADQAVIAIENVRLFTELQEKNQALTQAHAQVTEALEQQTATSELLKVIGRSTFDLQPVFETLAENAVRLCEAERALIERFDGQVLRLVADHNVSPELRAFIQQNPIAPGRHSGAGRAALERHTIHIHDVYADPEYTYTPKDVDPLRTMLAIPMIRADELLGVIVIYRHEVRPFTEGQIALMETFADQAAIAIENARLLSELQSRTHDLTRSVGELTALGEVGRALNSTLDLETVLQTIVLRANELAGTAGCTIWEYDAAREEFRLRVSHYADERDAAVLEAAGRVTTIPKGQGVTTRVMEHRQPAQISDITAAGAYESPIRRPLVEAGHRALLGVPLLSEDEVIGVLAVTRKAPGEFEPETVRLLSTFATQSALAIQNARLFLEIEDKNRQLDVASRHKSEFLANMSHELRTPLNAIIGFSEILNDRMFGELNEKQEEYLQDIHASGQHLLSLINDILDLSKIEAGRMELELAEFHLPTAIDNALILVRERAGRRGIRLGSTIDENLATIRADERKVKQVLLNLLSNALKFTPEGGRIDVRAAMNEGMAEISVTDTGVGIAPEDQEAIFEEFRQAGTADKKVEGTGLGLALSRKFIDLHGGRIWVKSRVGEGATFTFTLPGGSQE